MGRLKRLEAEVADLKAALANLQFRSEAPTVTVVVPVPVFDANGVATGGTATGYLPLKTGPTEGRITLGKKQAILSVR